MQPTPSTLRLRMLVVLVFLIALATIWGHYSAIGASAPDDPQRLQVTHTIHVLGAVPALVIDDTGWQLRWNGLLLGLGLTLVCALACRWWLRRLGRVA